MSNNCSKCCWHEYLFVIKFNQKEGLVWKYFGYLIVIVVGVLGFLLVMERASNIDNNLSKQESCEEIYS